AALIAIGNKDPRGDVNARLGEKLQLLDAITFSRRGHDGPRTKGRGRSLQPKRLGNFRSYLPAKFLASVLRLWRLTLRRQIRLMPQNQRENRLALAGILHRAIHRAI